MCLESWDGNIIKKIKLLFHVLQWQNTTTFIFEIT
jgi:hypothetical protein